MVKEERYGGELPVGEAILVPTGHKKISRMIVAPTMKTPRNITGTDNVFLATRAALLCSLEAGPPLEGVGFPGMGTGIGAMDPFEAAGQMCRAFVEVVKTAMRPD